jgi:hypothetical protein
MLEDGAQTDILGKPTNEQLAPRRSLRKMKPANKAYLENVLRAVLAEAETLRMGKLSERVKIFKMYTPQERAAFRVVVAGTAPADAYDGVPEGRLCACGPSTPRTPCPSPSTTRACAWTWWRI